MSDTSVERVVRITSANSSKGVAGDFYSPILEAHGGESLTGRWLALADHLSSNDVDQFIPASSSTSRWLSSISSSSTITVRDPLARSDKWWAEGGGYGMARRSYARALDDVSVTRDLVYGLEHQKNGRFASMFLVLFVERSFAQRDLAKVNELLSTIVLDHVTEFSMVALLRSSFSARAVLPAWTKLLDGVRLRLTEQNKNVERLLAGLNRP